MYTRTFKDPIYGLDFTVIHINSKYKTKKAIKLEKKYGLDETTCSAYAYEEFPYPRFGVVFYDEVTLGAIVHEVTHALINVMERNSMTAPCRENTEAYAFYSEFLFECVYSALKRFIKDR